MNVVNPKQKWGKVKIKRIHLSETVKLNKSHKNNFYKSLKMGYKYLKTCKKSLKPYIAAYYTLLNSAYYNERIIFSISLKSLNNLIQNDENLQEKQILSKQDYKTFILFLQQNQLVEIHNPNRQGKEGLILELKDIDFIGFFKEIIPGDVREKQLNEVINFVNPVNSKRDTKSYNKQTKNNQKKSLNALELRTQNLELRTQNSDSSSSSRLLFDDLPILETKEEEENNKNDTEKWNQFTSELKSIMGQRYNNLINLKFLYQLWPVIEIYKYPHFDQIMLIEKLDKFAEEVFLDSKSGPKIITKVTKLLDYMEMLGELYPIDLFHKIIEKIFESCQNSPVHARVKEVYHKEIDNVYNKMLIKHKRYLHEKRNRL